MLLTVPESVHELAMQQGFELRQIGPPASCCICDRCVPTFGWTYQLHQSGNMYDLWCTRCIESKLPEWVSSGRALR